MIVRESPDELTLRAEEVGTWKSYINVDHIEKGEVGSSLVDADWHEFCQALHKGIEGEDWEELYDAYKEMSRAVGRSSSRKSLRKQKPLENERQPRMQEKNTAIPVRDDNILGRKRDKIGTLGRAPQRHQLQRWTKP